MLLDSTHLKHLHCDNSHDFEYNLNQNLCLVILYRLVSPSLVGHYFFPSPFTIFLFFYFLCHENLASGVYELLFNTTACTILVLNVAHAGVFFLLN